eukprot:3665169-Rhodomonas_salina.2
MNRLASISLVARVFSITCVFQSRSLVFVRASGVSLQHRHRSFHVSSMFDFYNKFATSTQFYLYGKRECTQTGWQRASKKYAQPDLLADKDLSLAGKGIGKEITKFFATKGADVYMVCRSKERGEAAQEELKAECKNDRLHLIVADVGLEQDVRAAWVTFESHQKTARGSEPVRLDGLVCNAGALLNEKQLTAENVE